MISTIIPTYQNAGIVSTAIDAALEQGGEVVVIDDGSTDGTAERVKSRYAGTPVRLIRQEHAGPAAARNAGIEAAHGDFLQFLDADDTISPQKARRQLDAFTDEIGWVICDTRIVEVDGREELASARYGYAELDLGGWIQTHLFARNFIPIHAPLIRRSALGSIRFREGALEDWHFWFDLAGAARCRYIPDVLATYKKRRGSRNTGTKRDPMTSPGVAPPLRLNLGCGAPGKRSWHPMRGLVNLDKALGWRFEDGLPDIADGSVHGITVSHALMYVAEKAWPTVLGEFARVLRPGGVVRITEDNTEHPDSRTYGTGWRGSEPAATLTGPAMARRHLEAAGFTVYDVDAGTTRYVDESLRQSQHGEEPHVFYIEGVRESSVLFEPHADDGALFAAFSAIRYRPRIVTCFPSPKDYGDTATRAAETACAAEILGAGPCVQWNGRDLVAKMRELDAKVRPTRVFAPSTDTSHPEHLEVAEAAAAVFGDRLVRYQTYNSAGKVRAGRLVFFDPGWLDIKRRALGCYASQIAHPRAREFFSWDLAEYHE